MSSFKECLLKFSLPSLPSQIKREKAIKRKEALELAKKEEEDTRLAEVIISLVH